MAGSTPAGRSPAMPSCARPCGRAPPAITSAAAAIRSTPPGPITHSARPSQRVAVAPSRNRPPHAPVSRRVSGSSQPLTPPVTGIRSTTDRVLERLGARQPGDPRADDRDRAQTPSVASGSETAIRRGRVARVQRVHERASGQAERTLAAAAHRPRPLAQPLQRPRRQRGPVGGGDLGGGHLLARADHLAVAGIEVEQLLGRCRSRAGAAAAPARPDGIRAVLAGLGDELCDQRSHELGHRRRRRDAGRADARRVHQVLDGRVAADPVDGIGCRPVGGEGLDGVLAAEAGHQRVGGARTRARAWGSRRRGRPGPRGPRPSGPSSRERLVVGTA